jgi:hypothetical protein
MPVEEDVPESERRYQYEVEIKALSTGESRRIPLSVGRAISLKRLKRGEPEEPARDVFEVRVGDVVVRGYSFEEFREKLRAQYPDEAFERRLHYQRDREAEDRWRQGIRSLVSLLAESVVKDLMEGDPQGLLGKRRDGEQRTWCSVARARSCARRRRVRAGWVSSRVRR